MRGEFENRLLIASGDSIRVREDADTPSRAGQRGTVIEIYDEGLALDFGCGWDGKKETLPSIEFWEWGELDLDSLYTPPREPCDQKHTGKYEHVQTGQVWTERTGKNKRSLLVRMVFPKGHLFAPWPCVEVINCATGRRSTIRLRKFKADGTGDYVPVTRLPKYNDGRQMRGKPLIDIL